MTHAIANVKAEFRPVSKVARQNDLKYYAAESNENMSAYVRMFGANPKGGIKGSL